MSQFLLPAALIFKIVQKWKMKARESDASSSLIFSEVSEFGNYRKLNIQWRQSHRPASLGSCPGSLFAASINLVLHECFIRFCGHLLEEVARPCPDFGNALRPPQHAQINTIYNPFIVETSHLVLWICYMDDYQIALMLFRMVFTNALLCWEKHK
jgi:hypothetical protein